jgi:co-chaperonin GroES (HSP10)
MSDKAPIKMLHDRVLVSVDREGERRSSGGIVIPATAAMGGRRLSWAKVAAVGPHAPNRDQTKRRAPRAAGAGITITPHEPRYPANRSI